MALVFFLPLCDIREHHAPRANRLILILRQEYSHGISVNCLSVGKPNKKKIVAPT